MKTIESFFKLAVNTCTYTMAGKKCVKVATGKRTPPKKFDTREMEFRNGMKLGRNISLIGLFCPIFWVSSFTEVSKSTILFNASHSGIFIATGLVFVLFIFF